MKKKAAALAALALAGVMILTACSSSEQESDQQSAAKNDTIKNGTEVQTEEPLHTVSGTQSVSGTAVSVAGESGSASDATATAPAQSETAAAGETQTAQTSGTAVTETKSETESESADGDIWSGTYVADDETLTIAMAEDTQISFSFAEAGNIHFTCILFECGINSFVKGVFFNNEFDLSDVFFWGCHVL